MNKVLLLYIPVLHAGYLKLFNTQKENVSALAILGDDLAHELDPFTKEIRAIGAETMRGLIEGLRIFDSVTVVTQKTIESLNGQSIIAADEEVCHRAVAQYLQKATVEYIPVFLRWDEKNVKSDVKVQYDRVSTDAVDRTMVEEARQEAGKSGDWWRHVGAVIVKDGAVIMRDHNHHLPSDHTPYANGDPRDVIQAGTSPDLYTSIHAEQSMVARAAKEGVSLAGTSMYMNIFPCPPCAKIMASAGIKKCYFATGSAWLDAESVLRAHGVEIILVQ